jgi:hypothetical protein
MEHCNVECKWESYVEVSWNAGYMRELSVDKVKVDFIEILNGK